MERWGGRIGGEGVRMKAWNKVEMSRSGTEKELVGVVTCLLIKTSRCAFLLTSPNGGGRESASCMGTTI